MTKMEPEGWRKGNGKIHQIFPKTSTQPWLYRKPVEAQPAQSGSVPISTGAYVIYLGRTESSFCVILGDTVGWVDREEVYFKRVSEW